MGAILTTLSSLTPYLLLTSSRWESSKMSAARATRD